MLSVGCGLKEQPISLGVSDNVSYAIDDIVPRGLVFINLTSDQELAIYKYLRDLLMPKAYAASDVSSNVVYSNAASVTFTVNTANLIAGGFTGTTLSLGSFTITALSDNNLDLCGNGHQKCTTALLDVYTMGSQAGFINTSDPNPYGVPVYTSSENPGVQAPLNSPGVDIETVSGMPTNKHKVNLSDFPTVLFNVSSDFSNAGSGSYQMTFVVEYALAP